jgi:translation elongation factor EF-4
MLYQPETIITRCPAFIRFRPGQYKKSTISGSKMKLLTNDIHNYLELYDADQKGLISPKINLQDIINQIKEKIEETNAKSNRKLPALSADPFFQGYSPILWIILSNSETREDLLLK